MTKEEAIHLADSGWHTRCTYQEIVALQLFEERLVVPSFDIFHEAMEKSVGRSVQTIEFGLARNRLQREFENVVPDANKLIERMRQAKDSFVQAVDHRRIYQFQCLTKDIVGQTLSTEFLETEEFSCKKIDGMPAHFCFSMSHKKAWLELSSSSTINPWDRPKLEDKCVDYGVRDCDSMENAQQMLKELGYELEFTEMNSPAYQSETSDAELTKEEFIQQFKEICPVTDTVAQMWCQWSAELEETDRAGEEHPDWEYKTEAQFRGELLKLFAEVKTRYGAEVAGQVASLGDVPHCLYPWEIVPAAEHLHKGGDLKELPDMSIEGSLDGVEEYLEMKM